MCADEDRPSLHADRARGEHIVGLARRQDRAAKEPGEDRYLRHPDGDHDLPEPLPEDRDQPDREEQPRNREHDVGAAHDHRVHPAAEVAGQCAEEGAETEADGRGDEPDQQRVARAVDDAREHVPTLLVEPERMLGRRPGAADSTEAIQVADLWILRRHPRREEGHEEEDRDDHEADDRAGVVPEAAPRLVPEAARRLELKPSCFGFSDAHETRILGLISAYEMSTARFTSTKTSETKRIPPCRTG